MLTISSLGRKRILQRRIRLIVAITISYNVIEAIIALAGTKMDLMGHVERGCRR